MRGLVADEKMENISKKAFRNATRTSRRKVRNYSD